MCMITQPMFCMLLRVSSILVLYIVTTVGFVDFVMALHTLHVAKDEEQPYSGRIFDR